MIWRKSWRIGRPRPGAPFTVMSWRWKRTSSQMRGAASISGMILRRKFGLVSGMRALIEIERAVLVAHGRGRAEHRTIVQRADDHLAFMRRAWASRLRGSPWISRARR